MHCFRLGGTLSHSHMPTYWLLLWLYPFLPLVKLLCQWCCGKQKQKEQELINFNRQWKHTKRTVINQNYPKYFCVTMPGEHPVSKTSSTEGMSPRITQWHLLIKSLSTHLKRKGLSDSQNCTALPLNLGKFSPYTFQSSQTKKAGT